MPDERPRRRGLRGALTVACFVLLTGVTGCAHRPVNRPAQTFDLGSGYRFANTPPQAGNTDDIFVILAFSGGGTRAAAFSFGALEELRDLKFNWRGQQHALLDEVDIISSVSGGSFPAAYYGLHGSSGLNDFPGKFLYKNITLGLALSVLNPINWPRLASPSFSRIDLAAELYDREVFQGATFRDLAAVRSRPFIVLNATDLTYVSRFEFTQDEFDFLGSDLSSYAVARGVAASSAFPGLLTPLTLYNYQPAAGYTTPGWLEDAAKNRRASPRDYSYSIAMKSFLGGQRPFVHVMDGGLSDNIGLRGPAYALNSVQNPWNLMRYRNEGKIKCLVIITVNAKPGDATDIDRHESTPGLGAVLSVVSSGPLGNYSDETIQYVADFMEGQRQNIEIAERFAELRKLPKPTLPKIKFYPVELSFQDVADPTERAYLSGLATSFNLPREGIDRLRAAAKQLLRESPAIKRLIEDLAQDGAP